MPNITAAEAFPLYWPEGRPRTSYRNQSRFDQQGKFAYVRDQLLNELKLLRAKNVIISTNIALRRDGLPLAGQPQPKDHGVAVYFHRATGNVNRQLCFACDRWHRVEDNLWAVCKTIEALRGIARWGTGDMIEAAFKWFAALPPAGRPWHVVLGVPPNSDKGAVESAYKRRALECHPDRGGSQEQMAELNEAYARATA